MRPDLMRQGWASWGIVAMAASAAVSALLVAGGPGYARMERRDDERARVLTELDDRVRCLMGENGYRALPTDLADTPACPGRTQPKDPYTGRQIKPEAVSDTRYRMCADFELPQRPDRYGNRETNGDCFVFDTPKPDSRR